MITMYDTPKRVKLTDLFSDSGRKYYIQKFEYGDYIRNEPRYQRLFTQFKGGKRREIFGVFSDDVYPD